MGTHCGFIRSGIELPEKQRLIFIVNIVLSVRSSLFKPMNESMLELQARSMRDRVFEKKSTDSNWAGCKDNWMRPDSIKWLCEQIAKQDANPCKSRVH